MKKFFTWLAIWLACVLPSLLLAQWVFHSIGMPAEHPARVLTGSIIGFCAGTFAFRQIRP